MEKKLIPLSFFAKIQEMVEMTFHHASNQVRITVIIVTFELYLFITSVGFNDMLPGDVTIFKEGTQTHTLLKFVRAIYRPLAFSNDISTNIILFYISIALYIIIYIPVLICYFQLRVTGHINKYICYYIVVSVVFLERYICSALPTFIATAIYFVTTDFNAAKNINFYIMIVLSIAILVLQNLYIEAAVNTRISYKKGISWGWLPGDQTKCLIFINIHAFLSRLAEVYPFGITKYIFSALTFLFTLLFIIVSFLSPTLINSSVTATFMGSSLSGIVVLVLALIVNYVNFTSDEIVIIFLVGLAIFNVAGAWFLKRRNVRLNTLIDEYSSANCEIAETFKSPKNFLQAMRVGFSTGNPNLINWFVIKDAIKEWPENQDILKQYVIFLTSFVVDASEFEEAVVLLYTVNHTLTLLMNQAERITESRSKTLVLAHNSDMRRITKVTNQLSIIVNSYWSTLISGNTSKSFILAQKAHETSKLICELYNGCLSKYPNCAQICKMYAKYHEKFTGNNNAIIANCQKANILASSKFILMDQTEHDMHEFFSMLPEKPQTVGSTGFDLKEGKDEMSAESSHSNLSASASIVSVAEASAPEASNAFDKGIPIPVVSQTEVIVWAYFFVFFLAGSIGPAVYMLVQHDVLKKGVISAEYGAIIPVQLSRLGLLGAIRAVIQGGVVEDEGVVLGDSGNSTYRELMLNDIPDVIESLDSIRLDSVQDSGFGPVVYSFLNQEPITFADGTITYNLTAMEFLNTLLAALLEVTSYPEDADLFMSAGFKLALYNIGKVGQVMNDYVTLMIEGIMEMVDSTVSTITILTIIVLICLAVFSFLTVGSIIRLYRFYVHVTRCLIAIPKSAFLPIFPALEADSVSNSNNNNSKSKRKKGKQHDNSNLTAAHSEDSFPVKKMIFAQIIFFLLSILIHIVIFVTGLSSLQSIRRDPMNVLKSASLLTGMNVMGTHLLQCVALSQNKQITGYQMPMTAMLINIIADSNRGALSEMMMGVDEESGVKYGTLMYSSMRTKIPFNGTFVASTDIHKMLAYAEPMFSLSALIETAAEVGRRAGVTGATFDKDDYDITLYYHMLGRHVHTDFYKNYLSAATADVGESFFTYNENYIFLLGAQVVIGLAFIFFTHRSVILIRNVINHMISMLRFLKTDEVLACEPIANLLAGTSRENSAEKDLSMIASVNNCSTTAAFIVDKYFVVEWCNEAAGKMLGLQHTKLLQDRISTHTRFTCEKFMMILAGKEAFESDNNETVTFETDMDVFGTIKKGITASLTPANGKIVLTLSSKDEIVSKQEAIQMESEKIQKIMDYVIPVRFKQLLGEHPAAMFENVVIACFRVIKLQASALRSQVIDLKKDTKTEAEDPKEEEKECEEEDEDDAIMKKAPQIVQEEEPIVESQIERRLKESELFIQLLLSKLPESAAPISRIGNTQFCAFNINGRSNSLETIGTLMKVAQESRAALLMLGADITVSACYGRLAILGRASKASTTFNVFAPGVSGLLCSAAAGRPGSITVDEQCLSFVDEKRRELLNPTRFHNGWAFYIESYK